MEPFDRSAMLTALEGLVSAESPSLDKGLCDRCADAVAALFRERTGAEALRHRREQRGDHLEIQMGEGSGPGVLILLHHDTVWPQGTLARLPFRVEGDRVTGPGSYDMKAGIVEAAFALSRARLQGPVTILCTSDEEIASSSSRALIEDRARQASAVLVLEPAFSGGALKTSRKGVIEFTLHVQGRAAHAGVEPEKGVSAVIELADQILRLQRLGDPEHGTTINVGVVQGGTRPNVVAAEAWAQVDARVVSATEAARVTRAVRSLRPQLDGTRLSISGWEERPPMERTPAVARLAELARKLARQLGLELGEAGTGGASDGNFAAALGVATLDGLGPDGGGAHADSEHLLIGSWLSRTGLLQKLLEELPFHSE